MDYCISAMTSNSISAPSQKSWFMAVEEKGTGHLICLASYSCFKSKYASTGRKLHLSKPFHGVFNDKLVGILVAQGLFFGLY